MCDSGEPPNHRTKRTVSRSHVTRIRKPRCSFSNDAAKTHTRRVGGQLVPVNARTGYSATRPYAGKISPLSACS